MKFMEFVIGMKNKYQDKDLNDKETINEINHCICKYLSENTRGELLVGIYSGILEGKTQSSIAENFHVNKSLVADYLVKIRKLVSYLQSAGIELEQFKKFECRPHEFKPETIEKMNKRSGLKRNIK